MSYHPQSAPPPPTNPRPRPLPPTASTPDAVPKDDVPPDDDAACKVEEYADDESPRAHEARTARASVCATKECRGKPDVANASPSL
jgi:hypothetical protein